MPPRAAPPATLFAAATEVVAPLIGEPRGPGDGQLGRRPPAGEGVSVGEPPGLPQARVGTAEGPPRLPLFLAGDGSPAKKARGVQEGAAPLGLLQLPPCAGRDWGPGTAATTEEPGLAAARAWTEGCRPMLVGLAFTGAKGLR
mmetsp:Transcript_74541/g.235521  ORF Transcript_74541/g.235521 Transcript_74541/m.235521 type:complete len:143 (-) Transcript_74541:783-1211(-)